MPAEHSHCAYCDQDSVWTIGPATTWQSPYRPTKDVCFAHAIAAVIDMMNDGIAMVQVGALRKHYYGVTGHTT